MIWGEWGGVRKGRVYRLPIPCRTLTADIRTEPLLPAVCTKSFGRKHGLPARGTRKESLRLAGVQVLRHKWGIRCQQKMLERNPHSRYSNNTLTRPASTLVTKSRGHKCETPSKRHSNGILAEGVQIRDQIIWSQT